MKRIFLYACALVVLGLCLAALAASCGPAPKVIDKPTRTPTIAMTPPTVEEAMATWFPIPTLAPSFTPEPDLIYHYLILGVDNGPGRPKPVPGGAGDKTDVMLLVTVRNDIEPVHVTITQFPRNLWVSQYPAVLLFEVYRTYDFDGMRAYFLDVFGIDLDGIAAVDMTAFVEYVDRLGGVLISREAVGCEPGTKIEGSCHFDGTQLLAWLRDNDNNWGHGVYDAGMRQHRALIAILDAMYHQANLATVADSYDFYTQDVETDLSVVEFVEVANLAFNSVFQGMAIDYERLASPTIQRDEVPIPPYRAEVAATDLREWMQDIVGR